MTNNFKTYAHNNSYEVSNEEKKQAEKAIMFFNYALKLLQSSKAYLNLMKTPFKDHPEISPDDLMNTRSALRRFRDKLVDNFNNFKKAGFNCVNIMHIFGSDTQILKLMKSFVSSIDVLELKVNDLVELFNDLKSKDFVKNVVDQIEIVQNQCDDVEQVIEERVVDHIKKNIIAKNWVDYIGNDLQMKIEKKTPLIIELSNQRQKQLNDALNNGKK